MGNIRATLADRFWAKVNKTDDCWLWTGATRHERNRQAYGSIYVHEFREKRNAHRVAWFLAYGVWPDVVDHAVCDNGLCVRIDHLTDTTHAENIRRGNSPSAIAARTGVCQRGHSEWGTNNRGKRFCRPCARARLNAARRKNRRGDNTPAI